MKFNLTALLYICNVEKFCNHIEKLLAQHDYVVVPNLGGFVVQLHSAQLLSDRITPPLCNIGFNPLMHHADGLLAIEISRSEQISYRLAMEYIEKEVENIKSILLSTGNYTIGNLGTLSQISSENFLFSPTTNPDFLPQNFGLTNLFVSTKAQNLATDNKKIVITFHSSKVYRYAAAAMLIFGLFFTAPKLSDVRQSNNASIASLNFNIKNVENSRIQPAQEKSAINNESTQTPIETTKNFHVIVASLPTQISADKFCKELIENHFTNAHVLEPIKTYRIAIQSFSDKNEAIQFMENLRKTDDRFETAWVLCN
jgi:hypothetical protein